MGYAITWCAVPEADADRFLQDLQLSPTGATEEDPQSLITTARLDTGWRVLWYNRYACPFLRPKYLAGLSHDHEVLLCQVEEHVMASSAEMWSGGVRRWSLSHVGDEGPRGLSVEGDPPPAFSEIRQAMEEMQRAEGGDDADVDYIFEIPLQLAESLVGFKHDEDRTHVVGRFEVMARAADEGILRRLFGRRTRKGRSGSR
jgi:hypothetical protein